MRYNLAITEEADNAFEYLTELTGKEVEVNITKVIKQRSLPQNSYLHVLLGGLGNFLGYTLDEMKTIYKREVNPNLYVYDNNGRKFLKSSADLDKEEMSASIDKLRMFAENAGYPLPMESDVAWIRQLQNELEKVNYYL